MKLKDLKAGDRFYWFGSEYEYTGYVDADDDAVCMDDDNDIYPIDRDAEVKPIGQKSTLPPLPDGYELAPDDWIMEGDCLFRSRSSGKWLDVTILGKSVAEYLRYWSNVTHVARKKQPSYQERQEAWVKEHGLKVGDKVKILRSPTEAELPDCYLCHWPPRKNAQVGVVHTIGHISARHIELSSDYYPYFVLKPTTRPYNASEMRALVGKVLREKCDGDDHLVTDYHGDEETVFINATYYTADDLMGYFTHVDGSPCGVAE
jgi:hypothetical protein